MQVTIEDVNTVKKIIHIEVPEEKVASELDDAYKKMKKTAKVNGFRPGKAPRSVLERMYGKDVNADVSNKLIQDSLIEAIRENEVQFIGEPELDFPDLDPKATYKYTATVELKPELGQVDFSGIKLKKTAYSVSEEEISAQIEMISKNLATRENIDEVRATEVDDFILIDIESFVDGKLFEAIPVLVAGSHKIGSATYSKEFDDNIIGLNIGDVKEFEIDYTDDYINKSYAGNKVAFKVKLDSIQKEVLPEINDDFAKKVGDYETLEILTDSIKENLQGGYEKRTEHELNEQVYTALINLISFEVPGLMVRYELDGIIAEAEHAFAMNGITLEQIGKTKEDLESEYADLAEKQVRRHLILGAVVEQEKLELTDEELEAGYEETAKAINQPVAGIKAFYEQQPDKIEYFKHTLLEKKAIKLIIDTSDIEDVEPEKEEE